MTPTAPTLEQLTLVDNLLSEWYEVDHDKRSLDCDGYTSLRAIFINTIVKQAEAAAASARETANGNAAFVCVAFTKEQRVYEGPYAVAANAARECAKRILALNVDHSPTPAPVTPSAPIPMGGQHSAQTEPTESDGSDG